MFLPHSLGVVNSLQCLNDCLLQAFNVGRNWTYWAFLITSERFKATISSENLKNVPKVLQMFSVSRNVLHETTERENHWRSQDLHKTSCISLFYKISREVSVRWSFFNFPKVITNVQCACRLWRVTYQVDIHVPATLSASCRV